MVDRLTFRLNDRLLAKEDLWLSAALRSWLQGGISVRVEVVKAGLGCNFRQRNFQRFLSEPGLNFSV